MEMDNVNFLFKETQVTNELFRNNAELLVPFVLLKSLLV
jgi:hypothetical protein